MKELFKFACIFQSYSENKNDPIFGTHSVGFSAVC